MITFRIQRSGRPDFLGIGVTGQDLIDLTEGSDLVLPGEPYGLPEVEICIHFSPTTKTLIDEITRSAPHLAGTLAHAAEQVEASGEIRVVRSWDDKTEVKK